MAKHTGSHVPDEDGTSRENESPAAPLDRAGEPPVDGARPEGALAEEAVEDRGRYVEGGYGKAGTEHGHISHSPSGRYVEGDYGTAGTEDAVDDSERGRFVEADYGDAGTVPGRDGTETVGRYYTKDEGNKDKHKK